MGLNDELALASFRISLGRSTTQKDIDFAVEEIMSCVNQFKKVEI